jgi:hypothetical protein
MFLLFSLDLLQQATGGGIVGSHEMYHVSVTVDGDSFGNQIFLDHILE